MNGTYTSNPKDTTGLGEYSNEQLVTELKSREEFNQIHDQLIVEEYQERQMKFVKIGEK